MYVQILPPASSLSLADTESPLGREVFRLIPVWGLGFGFKVWGLGFGVWCLGFGVKGLGFGGRS
jgi:hypothetical protein